MSLNLERSSTSKAPQITIHHTDTHTVCPRMEKHSSSYEQSSPNNVRNLTLVPRCWSRFAGRVASPPTARTRLSSWRQKCSGSCIPIVKMLRILNPGRENARHPVRVRENARNPVRDAKNVVSRWLIWRCGWKRSFADTYLFVYKRSLLQNQASVWARHSGQPDWGSQPKRTSWAVKMDVYIYPTHSLKYTDLCMQGELSLNQSILVTSDLKVDSW